MSEQERQLTEGGRLQKLIEAGDSQELARRTFTLQSVALDLHRQFADVASPQELARVLSPDVGLWTDPPEPGAIEKFQDSPLLAEMSYDRAVALVRAEEHAEAAGALAKFR